MGLTALVAGASGLIGRELVKLLLSDKDFARVVILVRRELDIQHAKLEQRLVDFERIEEYVAEAGGLKDAIVFCTLGTTIKKAKTRDAFRRVDYEFPLRLARQSAADGAKQFHVVTALGSSSKSAFFYSRVKGQLEEALHQLKLQTLHIFRPSLLLGEREEVRFGERAAAAIAVRTALIWKGPLSPYKPIHGKTVAEAMLGLSKKPDRGIFIHQSSEITEQAEEYRSSRL